jgi:hypothetical protein
MAKLTRDDIEVIVKRDAPGYVMATTAPLDERSARAEPEESAPDIAALRAKYLGEAQAETAGTPDVATADAADEADDEIVSVRPEDVTDPWDQSSRPKARIISGKDRKIVGEQG